MGAVFTGEAHSSSSSCSDASDEEFKPVVRRSGRRASVDSRKRATKTGKRKRSITTRLLLIYVCMHASIERNEFYQFLGGLA